MSNTVKFQQAALFVLVCLTALEAQWQPLPPEDISLTGLAPAVRADTSRKPDGRIVDPDTLAGQVDIAYEGYYRFIPHVWLDSGNEQRNESFYLELHQGDQKILPQDPNVGPYKIILDDTLLYPDENVYIDRDAGLFYLKPGIHDIWMNHYIKVANEYPQFINYYPDGRGMHNAESVFIWQILAIRPEPRVDAAVSIVCTTPEYCFGDPDKTKLVPGDTMIVQVNLMNLMTDGYRNAFPFARLELAIPADLSIFDFSVPPLDGYTAGDKSITWEINQFSDANLQDLTISFKTVSTALNITNPELEFTAEFYVPNDRDIMNNSAQKTVALVEKEPCPTDCYIQLSSDDTDKTVSAGDSITYELIFGNIGLSF